MAVGNANVGAGHLYLHVAVNDNSRYAYVEQHPDERAPTCAAFLERALAHFGELGMGPVEAVMTDGARNYRTAAVFQEALARAGARHILTPVHMPCTRTPHDRRRPPVRGDVDGPARSSGSSSARSSSSEAVQGPGGAEGSGRSSSASVRPVPVDPPGGGLGGQLWAVGAPP